MSSFQALLGVHLACALGAAVTFWISAFSFKGGPPHRAAGEWFLRLIYAAAASGAVLAIAGIAVPSWGHPPQPGQTVDAWTEALRQHRQTMWVALYLLLIIVAPAQHGIAVVAAGPVPARARSRRHATLNLLCLAGTVLLLGATVAWQRWLLLFVVPVGFIIGLRNMSYASRSSATSQDWEREHLTSLVTTGIWMHTALLVFGTSRTVGYGPTEAWSWLVPTLVGLPTILWLRSRR